MDQRLAAVTETFRRLKTCCSYQAERAADSKYGVSALIKLEAYAKDLSEALVSAVVDDGVTARDAVTAAIEGWPALPRCALLRAARVTDATEAWRRVTDVILAAAVAKGDIGAAVAKAMELLQLLGRGTTSDPPAPTQTPLAEAAPAPALEILVERESLETGHGEPRETGRVRLRVLRPNTPARDDQVSREQYERIEHLCREGRLHFGASDADRKAGERLAGILRRWGAAVRLAPTRGGRVLTSATPISVRTVDGTADRRCSVKRLVREAGRRARGQDRAR